MCFSVSIRIRSTRSGHIVVSIPPASSSGQSVELPAIGTLVSDEPGDDLGQGGIRVHVVEGRDSRWLGTELDVSAKRRGQVSEQRVVTPFVFDDEPGEEPDRGRRGRCGRLFVLDEQFPLLSLVGRQLLVERLLPRAGADQFW